MTKPKISPTELAKFIALFDVDERVNDFKGERFKFFGPDMDEIIDYTRKELVFPGGLLDRSEPVRMIIWEEV